MNKRAGERSSKLNKRGNRAHSSASNINALTPDSFLGKGEVESSILSCSTIPFKGLEGLSGSSPLVR